jgi:hypothetical protein
MLGCTATLAAATSVRVAVLCGPVAVRESTVPAVAAAAPARIKLVQEGTQVRRCSHV